ncbi:MAG: T9SS type A sorting domain-containing protein [Candidatus Cloacimonetes bacterium]|nr:T9SS type A sorting domain-containing protein [Candidatus Cloacimonadota bacterium]
MLTQKKLRRIKMKKISILILLLALSVSILSAGSSIVGDMNSWNPADPAYDLSLNANGVWELTKTLAAAYYEYKVVEGDAWTDPNWPANQPLNLSEETSVSWKANLDDDLVFDSEHPPIVAGSFQSEIGGTDWDQTSTTTRMVDDGTNGDVTAGDDIYTYQVVIPTGSYECKVVLNNNWDQSTGGNLPFNSDGTTASTFTYDMSNNTTTVPSGGLSQEVTVTFQVYLGYETAGTYAGGVSVQGSIAPLDWTGGSTLLTDVDVDMIYTGDVIFPIGSNPNLEFKFTKSADGATWDWEVYTGNRTLTIDDSSPTQIIDPPLIFSQEGTLPVELSAFTAVYMNEFVNVSWQTATETDVIGYNIFRSEEDDFSTVQKVNTSIIPGHGTTTTPQSYEFTDVTADPYYTTYYYWLEVVNFGGTNNIYGSIEFEPVDVDQNGEMNIITSNLLPSFPNPVKMGQSVSFSFCLGGMEGTVRPVQLNIYNVLGQRVAEVINEDRVVNNYTVEWNTEDFGRGIYFYQLKTEDFQETKKLMID